MEKFGKTGISKAFRAISARPSSSDSPVCDCGRKIEPVSGAIRPDGRPLYAHQCQQCQAETKKAEQRRQLRQQREKRAAKLRKNVQAVIPPLFWAARLNYIAQPLRERMLCLPPGRGLYLWGPVGAGKSYAMCALLRSYIVAGYSVERIKWDKFCLDIRSCYNGGGNENRVTYPILEADKVLIEDIGASVGIGQAESNFARKTLQLLLDERMEQRRATSFTSNLPPEEIEKSFGQRSGSRMQAMCDVIKIAGKDRRR